MKAKQLFEYRENAAEVGDCFLGTVPAGLTSTGALLQALYDCLTLPGYFGFNWNALRDCLRDFHWIEQRRIVLRHLDLPPIPTADLRMYLEVLSEAVASWPPDEKHSLQVVFPARRRQDIAAIMKGE